MVRSVDKGVGGEGDFQKLKKSETRLSGEQKVE